MRWKVRLNWTQNNAKRRLRHLLKIDKQFKNNFVPVKSSSRSRSLQPVATFNLIVGDVKVWLLRVQRKRILSVKFLNIEFRF